MSNKTDTPTGLHTDLHTDLFLDISNEVCPMSFVLTKLALEKIELGQMLELVCQAGEPVRNISIQLKDEGHEITSVKKEGDNLFRIFVIKKD